LQIRYEFDARVASAAHELASKTIAEENHIAVTASLNAIRNLLVGGITEMAV
jgi:hypothetical protein